MKYFKYEIAVEAHPFLRTLFRFICSPHANPTADDLWDFVTHKVKYLAYRPWSSLDLNAGNSSRDGGHIEHAYAHQHYWEGTSYSIWFWIGDERVPRTRYVDSPFTEEDEESHTIAQVLDHLRAWYNQCFAEKGIPIRWEVVVKVTSSGGVVVSPKTIEIFEFPPDFR